MAQADRHISEGERRVRAMEMAMAKSVGLKMNADQARVSLALMVDLLAILKAHRQMILEAIEDIDRVQVIPAAPTSASAASARR